MTTPAPSPDLIAVATRVVAGLTGWRWTWPHRRVLDVYRVPYQTRTISLHGRPVSAVYSVKGPTGELIDPSQYQVNNGFQIWFLNPQEWWWPGGLYDIAAPPPWWNQSWYGTRQPPDARDVQVDYAYGSPPPIDVQRAITQLATELAAAECGGPCALPQRVTSITREGISYTLLDPQDFIDNGRTGLYFVDLVIKMYKGSGARARVMSPEVGPVRRISTRVLT